MSCCSGSGACHMPSSNSQEMPCCAEQDVHWEHLQTQAITIHSYAFVALIQQPLEPVHFGTASQTNNPTTCNKAPPKCLEPELSKLQRFCI